MATDSELRIGDADREAAAAELREHYAQGRLSLAEFNQRLDAIFAAATRADLRHVIADLPHAMPRSVPLPAGQSRRSRQDAGAGPPRRGRLWLPAVLAALLAWVLLAGVLLPGLRFWPLPGKIGILLGVIAAARWLLRLILRGRYGRR